MTAARLRPVLLACLAVALGALPGHAGEKITGVVEMFTSQGCNSCPEADAVLGELAQRRDLIALAYHVDYWDYLGWQDSFGSRENTRRQKLYKAALGGRSVYTPQAVLNGRAEMNGSDREALLRALNEMGNAGAAPLVAITAERRGDSLLIDVGDGGGGVEMAAQQPDVAAPDSPEPSGQAHLLVVAFGPATPVSIGHGENGGRTKAGAPCAARATSGGRCHHHRIAA